jgi:hypothetical protein
MEVASSGVPNGAPTPETAALVDSGAVIQYLAEVLQVTLGAQRSELESAGSLLSESKYNETLQRCTRFASEAQVALYVQKDIVTVEETNGEAEDQGMSSPGAQALDGMVLIRVAKKQPCNMFTTSPPISRPLQQPCPPWLSSNGLLPST